MTDEADRSAKDGVFVCEQHMPEPGRIAWEVDTTGVRLQCDHCERHAFRFVLEKKEISA